MVNMLSKDNIRYFHDNKISHFYVKTAKLENKTFCLGINIWPEWPDAYKQKKVEWTKKEFFSP